MQGCCGAGRAAGCGGSTTWGRTSRGGTSRRRRRRWSSSSTPPLATGAPLSDTLLISPNCLDFVCRLDLVLWLLFLHSKEFGSTEHMLHGVIAQSSCIRSSRKDSVLSMVPLCLCRRWARQNWNWQASEEPPWKFQAETLRRFCWQK